MLETDCFDEFYESLSDIVNTSFNLLEPIPDARVVKKILRSLPKRFIPKVTVLNTLGNLSRLKLKELVGDLQTYEIDMFPGIVKPKDRGIALKDQTRKVKEVFTSDRKNRVSFCESESEDKSDFDMALLVKNFKKFLQF